LITRLDPLLVATSVVDFEVASVRDRAALLAGGSKDPVAIAHACYTWVRDTIAHTGDHGHGPVTCSASEVLRHATGFCYAKSHLLVALLRANGIPAGFSYQRLGCADSRSGFCLHGLAAVWLPDFGFYRVDARGQRADLSADFCPPREVLPFACSAPGEIDFRGVWAAPVGSVVASLQRHEACADLLADLPDEVALSAPDVELART
jgi:hypothetical protein